MIKKIFDYLILKGKTISFAESCSGGNLSLSITKIVGASKVFKGSIVSYSTFSKEKVIGIERNEIDSFSSGIISLLTCGITMGHYTWYNLF